MKKTRGGQQSKVEEESSNTRLHGNKDVDLGRIRQDWHGRTHYSEPLR